MGALDVDAVCDAVDLGDALHERAAKRPARGSGDGRACRRGQGSRPRQGNSKKATPAEVEQAPAEKVGQEVAASEQQRESEPPSIKRETEVQDDFAGATKPKSILTLTPGMLRRLGLVTASDEPEADAGEVGDPPLARRPHTLGEVVADAASMGKEHLEIAHDLEDSHHVSVRRHLCIEAKERAWKQPLLRCPSLSVSNEGVRLSLHCLTLVAKPGQEVLLELQTGSLCELVDCRLQRGAIKLGTGSSARLVRSSVSESQGAGIMGKNFHELVMEDSQVSRCCGDGLRLGKGHQVCVMDCTFIDNTQSGAVVAGNTADWKFERCTFSGNGHYGVWTDAGASVGWGSNTLADNGLGEKGGRGQLDGWAPGVSFKAGDECAVWSEEERGWLKAHVLRFAPKEVNVKVLAPDAKLPSEMIVPPRAVRQPRSGNRGVPSWSAHWPSASASAFELFLREGGADRRAWMLLSVEVREGFHVRARRAKADLTESTDKGCSPSKKQRKISGVASSRKRRRAWW